MTTDPTWTPITALSARFDANLAALASRDVALAGRLRAHAPAAEHFIATVDGAVRFGRRDGGHVSALPVTLSPQAAAATRDALCPGGVYAGPVLVAGEDQGWLWDAVQRLPLEATGISGHRPPLYLAIADVDRLWVLLHVHDWRTMLAAPRVRLLIGGDAVDQIARMLTDDHAWRWPDRWVTVDPAFWPAGTSLETLRERAVAARTATLRRWTADATPAEAAAVAARLVGGGPLRVLGFTSRFTTFLQHSMRDWLAAFERLGHATRLVIEPADHALGNPLIDAAACVEFRPDLIVIIDHYRAECPSLPRHVPVVMWVQDRLPNIYAPAAGAAQGPLDFCIGSGRLTLTRDFGYPAERFMACPVGTNVERYAPTPPTAGEAARFGCDVSYVSHASEPADRIVDRELNGAPADVRRVVDAAVGRMAGHYAGDHRILGEVHLRRFLREAEAAAGVRLAEPALGPLLDLLVQRVNNALVRHQSLLWLADLGVDLRLYGNGWDRHPRLARFARGPVDNQTDLSAVYRCTAVNLQVTPFGCVHQRLLDGLAAGGFFLARWHQVDAIGTAYQHIWSWCQTADVRDTADLFRRAPAPVARLLRRIDALQGYVAADEGVPLFEAIRSVAEGGFAVSADSIWGDDHAAIAFATGDELAAKLAAALADPAGRRATADRMRAAVVDRFSYRAITAGLLTLVAGSLSSAAPLSEAA